jgi:chromosome partitioning protein
MIVLCTHNSGGVGKTTLAIHTTGILQASALNSRTLLLDCDDQADAWQFYAPERPKKLKDSLIRNDGITVIWNKNRDTLRRIAKPERYDHIIIDIDSPLQNTVQVMVDNQPDLVLIPINHSQVTKALRSLPITLGIVTQLALTTGFTPKTIIVPLGVARDRIEPILSALPTAPYPLSIAPTMPELQTQMQTAIYQDRRYIWEYQGQENLKSYFQNLLDL